MAMVKILLEGFLLLVSENVVRKDHSKECESTNAGDLWAATDALRIMCVVAVIALANGDVFSTLGVGNASVFLAARSVSSNNAASGSEQAQDNAFVPDSGRKAWAGSGADEPFLGVACFATIVIPCNSTEDAGHHAALVSPALFPLGSGQAYECKKGQDGEAEFHRSHLDCILLLSIFQWKGRLSFE